MTVDGGDGGRLKANGWWGMEGGGEKRKKENMKKGKQRGRR